MINPDNYPKLITVGDETYHVCFARKLNDGDLGFCDSDMKLIAISRDQTPDEMLCTFWHEILHAAEFSLGIDLGHPKIPKLEVLLAQVSLDLMRSQGVKE